jgi:hypothetical protein
MQALATVMAEIPRDTFDVSTLAGKVGSDPMTLTAWVRDNTYWVPYSGALRGPRGVLMDRLGSSLDRSLLLAELLTDAGHSVRLATRTLSDAAASAIVTRAQAIPVEIPGTRLEVPGEPSAEEYTRYAELSGLDASVLKAGTAAMRSRATSAAEEAQRRVVSQTAFLTSATNAHPAANDRSVHAAAKEHWWVQVQHGSEWIDLDPFGPAEASAIHEAPQQTFPYEVGVDGRLPVPDRYVHAVTIRIVVEASTAKDRKEQVVLTHTLHPAEAAGASIVFRNIARDWPSPETLTAAGGPAALKDIALKQTEWLPSLSVGQRTVEQASFTLAGDLNPQPRQGGGRQSSGSPLGGFDALSGGETTAESEAQLTAEWIEYEVRTPDAPPRVVRREVFDLLGPEQRSTTNHAAPEMTDSKRLLRSLALLTTVEILPMGSRLSPEFTLHRSLQALDENQDALTHVASELAAHNSQKAFEHGLRLKPTSDRLFDLALARFAWSPAAGDVYLASPNVLTFRTGLRVDASDRLIEQSGFDIVVNAVAVRPGASRSAFQARLTQGVADTNTEAILQGADRVSNAAIALAEQPGAEAWITLQGPADSALEKSDWPLQSRLQLKQTLAHGYVVVIPKSVAHEPADRVWWRIDPRTGDTLGMGELGWGQGLAEKVLVTALVFVEGGWGTFLACSVVQDARGETEYVGKCLCAGLAGGAIAGGAVTAGVGGLVAAMALAGMLKEAICV